MIQLTDYIIEKFRINSETVSKKINVDKLNTTNETIYDDTELDDDDKDVSWEDCELELETINNKFDRFLVTRYESLTKIKDFEKSIYNIAMDLLDLKDNIITGKDLGYAIRLVGGHLEIDCINSGSRGTYYIYSLSPEAYENMQTWWETPDDLEGKDDKEKLSFLFDKGNIIEINI